VKTGRSYNEPSLVETLAAACRGLPDVPQTTTVETRAKTQEIKTSIRGRSVHGLSDLQNDPDSFRRQRNALLVSCRANRRVIGTDEALGYIQQHGLYTGDWEEGLGRRTIRVGQILDYIAKTFDPSRCRSTRPISLGRFRRWASLCQGWRGPDRVALDEYGRVCRGKNRTVVGPDFLAVFMAVVEYLLIVDKNEDDTVPQERAKAIWTDLYITGQTTVRYCPRKWAICRNKLEALGIIRIDHTHYHGQAMKWWPTDRFPSQRTEKVRGMLDAVEPEVFQKVIREKKGHNTLWQQVAISQMPVVGFPSHHPLPRGSPTTNDANNQAAAACLV
jgi:hypothetical protein